jgi:hypothetical protein
MTTLTLEKIATELGGKLWEKGTLKRVYLDRGYNTKKMSTKVYVEEKEGQIVVRVYIDCSNQPYSWIEQKSEELKEEIWAEIDAINEDSEN